MTTTNNGAKVVYHPAIERLGLHKKTYGKEPSPRHILNYLMNNDMLKETDLQAAYDAVLAQNGGKEKAAELKKEPSNVRTRHISLRFYYNGAGYSGLAENLGSDTDNSVEKVLFAGLAKTHLCLSRDTYSRCGRTDKGVSSAGQVVAMHLKSNFAQNASWDEAGTQLVADSDLPKNSVDKIRVWVPPKKGGPRVQREISEYPYDKAINNVLPTTIRILGWCPVSPDFSARFSARTRTYRYFFVKRANMDIDKMKEGLAMMTGRKDFRNFCKMDVEKVYNWERLIHSAEIIQCDSQDVYYFQILGQAFLWHQIRCMVSVLFLIGRGLEEPNIVEKMLDVETNPGKPAYQLAPELPLVLHHCGFNDLQVGHTAQNLWSLSCELEGEWEEQMLAAERRRNCLESFQEFKVLRGDLVDFAKSKLKERFKKKQKYNPTKETWEQHLATLEEGLPARDDPALVTWGKALVWLATKELIPSPQSLREPIHIPLLKGFVGPTFEEKLDALGKGSKRRNDRYEENIVKKRQTKAHDVAFYEHMTKQGGSAI